MTDLEKARIAAEVELRHADLLRGVERWGAGMADRLDKLVVESLGPLEDLLHTRLETQDDDEVSLRRAIRAYGELAATLGSISAAMRIGPPTTAGYRLHALVSELRCAASASDVCAPAGCEEPR